MSSGPVFLQYPDGVMPDEMIDPIRDAAAEGGASLWVNGIDPGFANDWLALMLTSISERIDEVRCMEILNYATYDQAMVLFDIMGFGKPLDEVPFILLPGILTTAWGSVVRQLAAGLGVELDEIEEHYERRAGARDLRDRRPAPSRRAPRPRCASRCAARSATGRPIVLEHVTRLRDDLAPDWPQPTGHGGYRVIVTGEPIYTLDLQLLGTDGDHNTAGLKATAMRLVNAVPAVVAAPPGLLTALDLPLITGRGLVR